MKTSPERKSSQSLKKRFYQIKYRCGQHPSYKHVTFDFESPARAAELVLAYLGPPPEGATIDRIDPRGPYALENIRYAGRLAQSINRSIVKEGWRSEQASAANFEARRLETSEASSGALSKEPNEMFQEISKSREASDSKTLKRPKGKKAKEFCSEMKIKREISRACKRRRASRAGRSDG
jgi:hypothetical protein